ncbi:MAG: hypothetical protein Q9169_005945 [Polycauliona sp. 2 TL-2023]
MDLAVSMSSNEHATPPYESLHSSAGPASPSLQSHRTSHQPTSSHSTRRRNPPSSRASPAPQSFLPFDNTDMDFAPTTIATATTSTTIQSDLHPPWPGVNPPTLSDGQDHDRMETDDDDHDTASEDTMSTPHHRQSDPAVPPDSPQAHSDHDEAMDTTPDNPHPEVPSTRQLLGKAHYPQQQEINRPDSQAASSDEDEAPPPNLSTANQSQPLLDSSVVEGTASNGGWSPLVPAPPDPAPAANITDPINPVTESPNPATPSAPQDDVHVETVTAASAENTTTPPALDEGAPPPPQQQDNNPADPEQQTGREAEEDPEEDSSDEEERAYWADFVEDTSGPDEDELRVMEQEEEKDALDHDRWESTTYEPLDDPEYVPGVCGQIQWTVTPINGTPDKPNRAKIMRSPSVLIGGLYWNIKYFPRGNDGTEQMSVYVECSSSPDGPEPADDSDNESSCNDEGEAPSNEEPPPPPSDDAVQQPDATSPSVEMPPEADGEETKVVKDQPEHETKGNTNWEAAAQIGCIVYNPKEPRVNMFRKSCHRFTKANPDWGWTRFHGPWETIHLRKRRQRQALLRNDTLAFTAYIRIVQDDTKSLWWHAPKKGSDWDSYERIGVKSLATGSSRDSAMVAAISCWLHLNPIVEMIQDMKIPDTAADPNERQRPLFSALKELVAIMSRASEETDQQSMVDVTSWLDWYITDTQISRTDLSIPVGVWESIRLVLNREASYTSNRTTLPDLFQDILLLKQPDAWDHESPISSTPTDKVSEQEQMSKPAEACSVQETIDLASSSVNPFRVWGSSDGRSLDDFERPAILQVELHRHSYDKKTRKWNKLTHHIELNNTVTYTAPKTGSKCDYTLFGFVVQAGALTSQDCYSVIRPLGPGSRWIKYSGNPSYRGASCLTTSQAVTAQEGKGKDTTGDSAVAHIVIYVRTDSLSSILYTPPTHTRPPTPVSKDASSQPDAESEQAMPLRVYNSTLFNSHVGRGLPDLWAPVNQQSPNPILDLRIPKTTPIGQEIERLDEGFLKPSNDPETADQLYTCGLWYLKSDLSSVQGLPRILPVAKEDTLEKVSDRHDVCRVWLHLQESDVSEENTNEAPVEEPAETPEDQPETPAVGVEPEDSVMTQDAPSEPPISNTEHDDYAGLLPTPADAVPQSSPPPLVPVDDIVTAIAQDETTTQTESRDADMMQAPSTEEVPPAGDAAPVESTSNNPPEFGDAPSAPPSAMGIDAPPMPPLPRGDTEPTADLDDTPMDEVQEPVVSTENEKSAPGPPTKRLIYFFVKVFDLEKQELRGVGSRLVPIDNDIHTEVGRIVGTEEPMELYLEKGRVMWQDDQVRSSRSFSDYDLRDGCILIVHRRPTPEQATSLVTQGKHISPLTYFMHLRYNEPHRQTHQVKSEYGTEYLSAPHTNGLIHGAGTKIYSNGDAYIGHWASDLKTGHGTMAYSTGDTYTGNWSLDQPSGEGTMVYGKTANVYTGGWKKGRRHGKGTMRYEVADEELAMCKICYESEMDALFFDCGHVVACEECARQVDICPVCRKSVKAVCRIWRT